MGRPQEQTQHELRQAQPCSALLLRQGVSLKIKVWSSFTRCSKPYDFVSSVEHNRIYFAVCPSWEWGLLSWKDNSS